MHIGAQQSRSSSAPKSSRSSRDLFPSLKTHSSTGRYSCSYLRQVTKAGHSTGQTKTDGAALDDSQRCKHQRGFCTDRHCSARTQTAAVVRPPNQREYRSPKSPPSLGGKLQDFGTVRHHSDVLAVRAHCVAGNASDIGYPAAGETQANSIRVPPGSRTIKCTLGPLPDRSGANSIMVPGHAATRSCKASSALRSATFNAR